MKPNVQSHYSRSSAPSQANDGSFRRLLLVLLITGALLPVAVIIWQSQIWRTASEPAGAGKLSSSAQPLVPRAIPLNSSSIQSRPLYPYSVIPGGAGDAQELKNAISSDRVVAAHYADFNTANARVVRLDHARAVYVSYRLHNRIYWTSRTLTLPRGETVLTDGENEARTRCGNRISETPRTPVALVEPESAVLDNPEPAVASLVEPVGPLPFPLAAPPIATSVPPGGGSIFVPPIVPVAPGGGGGPDAPPKPPVPPLATPEPGTLLLVCTGFAGAWLTRKRAHR